MSLYFYRFLDKIYSLSSPEALVAFTRCPRSYLLPPQPEIPFKVCVVGPPTSGKTALSKALALHYSAQVGSLEHSTAFEELYMFCLLPRSYLCKI